MVDEGYFALKATRKVHRSLPSVSSHVDSTPSDKEVAVTFSNLAIPSEKEVAKAFETESGGSLLT